MSLHNLLRRWKWFGSILCILSAIGVAVRFDSVSSELIALGLLALSIGFASFSRAPQQPSSQPEIRGFSAREDFDAIWNHLKTFKELILIGQGPFDSYFDEVELLRKHAEKIRVYLSFNQDFSLDPDKPASMLEGPVAYYHGDNTFWGFVAIGRERKHGSMQTEVLVNIPVGSDDPFVGFHLSGDAGRRLGQAILLRLDNTPPGIVRLDSQEMALYVQREKLNFDRKLSELSKGVPLKGIEEICEKMSRTLQKTIHELLVTHVALDLPNITSLDEQPFKKWIEENYAAVERGVKIERIFIVARNLRDHPLLQAVMMEMQKRGIAVLLCESTRIPDFCRDFSLYDQKRLIRISVDDQGWMGQPQGRLTASGRQISEYQQIYRTIRENADPFTPPPPPLTIWITGSFPGEEDVIFERKTKVSSHVQADRLPWEAWGQGHPRPVRSASSRPLRIFHIRGQNWLDRGRSLRDQDVRNGDVLILRDYAQAELDAVLPVLRRVALPAHIDPDQVDRSSISLAEHDGRVQSSNGKVRLLIVSSNPVDTPSLRLDEEVREIKEALRSTPYGRDFQAEVAPAARVKDLLEEFDEKRPRILHFSGHGARTSELILQNERGHSQSVPLEALEQLCSSGSDHLQCVVLNACFSERQAAAIARHVDLVVGMSREVDDRAAMAFSRGFYKAIGLGKHAEEAFEKGRMALHLEGADPSIVKRLGREAAPNRLYLHRLEPRK